MTLTIAQIAAMALNGVQGAISDAIPVATLTRTTQGAYDAANDIYLTTDESWTGRAVFDNARPSKDYFPQLVVGPKDSLVYLEGFPSVIENDLLTVSGQVRTITAVADIGMAGSFFAAIATG